MDSGYTYFMLTSCKTKQICTVNICDDVESSKESTINVNIYIYTYIYMFLFIYIYIYLFIYLSMYLCICLFIYLFIYVFIYLFIYAFIQWVNVCSLLGNYCASNKIFRLTVHSSLHPFIRKMPPIRNAWWRDGHPTFNRNPYNGYINPYYWVDDHPLLYGNNGSLDPGTYDSCTSLYIPSSASLQLKSRKSRHQG